MNTTYTRISLLLLIVGLLLVPGHLQPHIQPLAAAQPVDPQQNIAPTYQVFATREGLVGYQTANGHIIQERDHFVALPSWNVLSSYQGYEFQVRVTYNGRTTIAPVWDVGPWNTDDRYWSPDRGMYPDLPIGLPAATAAYLNGYNGGLDEFGRVVTNPSGIDLADGVFWDDLGMIGSDWVEVSFLWLGEDPGPGAAVQAPIPAPPQGSAPAPPPDPGAPPPAAPDPPDNPAPDPAAPQPPPEEPLDNPVVAVGAIAVDNGDSSFTNGTISLQSARCGLNGTHNWTTSQVSTEQRASWAPTLQPGAYEVMIYIPGCGDSIDAGVTSAAQYAVIHDEGVTNLLVNQGAATGRWVSLGIYPFGRKTTPIIELSSQTTDVGRAVLFDAITWNTVPDSNAPTSRMVSIAYERNGFRVEWAGDDVGTGVASYDVQVRQLPRGGWRRWLSDEDRTSAWFGPHEGDHFAFRVRARDYAGNEEAWREGEMGDIDSTQATKDP